MDSELQEAEIRTLCMSQRESFFSEGDAKLKILQTYETCLLYFTSDE